ncbi:Calcium-transporting ATPase 2, endoplasmic reticulum-type [Stylosanthes scabra]|uniref:Calcium-transporting ATPase 2, endoplasmic reticulum-type n=1 Tax=Stylosanthes scabra TaxID=79078 RepID=A0ABU6TKU9_9FABA|nr:Calcium-transporting ATPase 2, endoplasmic reticulum-type [Stylosanthes scabra]
MEIPMEEKPFPAWSWSVEQCLKEYGVKFEKGLSTFEVRKRRKKYGWKLERVSKREREAIVAIGSRTIRDMLRAKFGAEVAKENARNEKIVKESLKAKSKAYAYAPKESVRTHCHALGVTS